MLWVTLQETSIPPRGSKNTHTPSYFTQQKTVVTITLLNGRNFILKSNNSVTSIQKRNTLDQKCDKYQQCFNTTFREMLHLVVVKIIPTLFWNFNTKFFSFCNVALTSVHSWLVELQERKDKISTYCMSTHVMVKRKTNCQWPQVW